MGIHQALVLRMDHHKVVNNLDLTSIYKQYIFSKII